MTYEGVAVLLAFSSLLIVIVTLSTAGYNEEYEERFELTCDELAFDKIDNPYDRATYNVYKKKCIPEELKNAPLLEIAEYFANLDCKSLATHIVKRHFNFEEAELTYKFKCGDQANIDFEPLDIKFEKSKEPKKIVEPKQNRGRN